jgi:hypothetical protein
MQRVLSNNRQAALLSRTGRTWASRGEDESMADATLAHAVLRHGRGCRLQTLDPTRLPAGSLILEASKVSSKARMLPSERGRISHSGTHTTTDFTATTSENRQTRHARMLGRDAASTWQQAQVSAPDTVGSEPAEGPSVKRNLGRRVCCQAQQRSNPPSHSTLRDSEPIPTHTHAAAACTIPMQHQTPQTPTLTQTSSPILPTAAVTPE